MLTRLAAVHAGLELHLNFNDRLVDLLEDGFDLAIRNGPLGSGSGLTSRKVVQEQTRVFASPGYIERHGAPQTLDELSDHLAITYGRSGRLQTWRFPSAKPSFQEVRPPTRMRFDDLDAIADAVAAGFGLAWLPEWLVRDRLRAGTLVRVLTDLPAHVTDIHVIWPTTSHLPMRVRLAIDALVAEVPRLTGVTK